jgi:hypothetical protein
VWQGSHPKAVPFDMYVGGGFGHEGENCTFETLCLRFGIRDKVVHLIGQAIHDADFDDGKFGRTEGITINHVLNPPIPRSNFTTSAPAGIWK